VLNKPSMSLEVNSPLQNKVIDLPIYLPIIVWKYKCDSALNSICFSFIIISIL
jgi:hypothetical protein